MTTWPQLLIYVLSMAALGCNSKVEQLWQRPYCPQNLKYLPSDLLQKSLLTSVLDCSVDAQGLTCACPTVLSLPPEHAGASTLAWPLRVVQGWGVQEWECSLEAHVQVPDSERGSRQREAGCHLAAPPCFCRELWGSQSSKSALGLPAH